MSNNADRAAFVAELSDFIFERKDLSLGEILYSVLRPQGKEKAQKISYLLQSTDIEIVRRVETAKEIENE